MHLCTPTSSATPPCQIVPPREIELPGSVPSGYIPNLPEPFATRVLDHLALFVPAKGSAALEPVADAGHGSAPTSATHTPVASPAMKPSTPVRPGSTTAAASSGKHMFGGQAGSSSATAVPAPAAGAAHGTATAVTGEGCMETTHVCVARDGHMGIFLCRWWWWDHDCRFLAQVMRVARTSRLG